MPSLYVGLLIATTAVAGAPPPARLIGHVSEAAPHAPIPAAHITVPGPTIGVVTNDSGVFTVRLPADAKSSLTVRRIDYLPGERHR